MTRHGNNTHCRDITRLIPPAAFLFISNTHPTMQTNNETHEYPGQWVTVPAIAENGNTIFVTGRTDVDRFRKKPRYDIRIDVSFAYSGNMPDDATAAVLEKVTDALVDTFKADPVAVLTGIYTGDGQRQWIFYAGSTHIFQRKFNEALNDLPTLPISMTAENDPHWEEYTEMSHILDEPGLP